MSSCDRHSGADLYISSVSDLVKWIQNILLFLFDFYSCLL